METTTSTKEITAALLDFHKKIGVIRKDSDNPFFKSKYADLSSILRTVTPVLNECGLVITQWPEDDSCLTTRISHVSGEWMEARICLKSKESGPQAQGSAITYARRYALGAILSLNIDEDDDGNAAQGNGKPTTSRPSAPTADKPASDKQIGLIQDLCAQKAVPADQLTRIELNNVNGWTAKTASACIEYLTKLPAKGGKS